MKSNMIGVFDSKILLHLFQVSWAIILIKLERIQDCENNDVIMTVGNLMNRLTLKKCPVSNRHSRIS